VVGAGAAPVGTDGAVGGFGLGGGGPQDAPAKSTASPKEREPPCQVVPLPRRVRLFMCRSFRRSTAEEQAFAEMPPWLSAIDVNVIVMVATGFGANDVGETSLFLERAKHVAQKLPASIG